jgi:hypothetical protein
MNNKDNTIENLKILKQVKPDNAFVKGTKNLILATKPHTKHLPIWATSLALMSAFILLITSGIIISNQNPTISSSLNESFLTEEFNDMDLNLQIEEITYSQDIHDTIASALNEISNSKTNHMNSSIIESENDYINQLENVENEEEINNLLNRVIN